MLLTIDTKRNFNIITRCRVTRSLGSHITPQRMENTLFGIQAKVTGWLVKIHIVEMVKDISRRNQNQAVLMILPGPGNLAISVVNGRTQTKESAFIAGIN